VAYSVRRVTSYKGVVLSGSGTVFVASRIKQGRELRGGALFAYFEYEMSEVRKDPLAEINRAAQVSSQGTTIKPVLRMPD